MIPDEKLPENILIEKKILGFAIFLKDNLCITKIISLLSEDDFFAPKNKNIFKAIFNLNNQNQKVNIENLVTELKNKKQFDKDGVNFQYFEELKENTIASEKEDLEEFISFLKQATLLRNLLKTTNEIEKKYLTCKIDSYVSFVNEIQKKISEVLEKRKISSFVDSKVISKDTKDYIQKLMVSERKNLIGFDSGFSILNEISNGLQKKNLIVIAGRTGVGKTTFALNIALNVAKNEDITVAIFSLEMSYVQLCIRLLSSATSIDNKKISSGRLDDREEEIVFGELKQMEKLKIYIDESSSLTIFDLINKVKVLKSEKPDLGLVVIDYLGLISKDQGKKIESRQLEIQEYTRKLHELARELDISIVLVSQLNRKIDDRKDGKPKLSDLRESGSIEQDAELVLLMYKPMKKDENNIINIKIAKNRNGISDYEFPLNFANNVNKFININRNYDAN